MLVTPSAPASIAQTYQPSDQIPVADNTLGTQVSGANNNFTITGGLNRGQNLFHSFQDFSVPTGGAATFINPAGNRSIITRVTGGNFSDIDGLVNTQGANFFLINPNGIVFGANARLDVGQTFVGSTANGIDLVDAGGNSYRFGTNGNDAPLLTINPNALLTPARLILGVSRPNSPGIVNYGTIAPQNDSQYIGLIGGNVTLDGRYGGGKIVAPGGRVDLGGLATTASIGLSEANNLINLSYPVGVTRANVTLTDGASVSVAGSGGGSVAVNAQNLNVLNGSEIAAGVSQNAPNSQAENIDIDVVGNIERLSLIESDKLNLFK